VDVYLFDLFSIISVAVFPPWERSMAEAKVPYYIKFVDKLHLVI